MVIMYKRRQKDLSSVCENPDGFVLLSSITHRRFSVFT